jgi:flavin-binding protein dodecin
VPFGTAVVRQSKRRVPVVPFHARQSRVFQPRAAPAHNAFQGAHMTVARISEISSISDKSFEDAIVQGVARANKTLKNVKGAWVKEQEVTIDNGKVTGYKVILKVTFVLTD